MICLTAESLKLTFGIFTLKKIMGKACFDEVKCCAR